MKKSDRMRGVQNCFEYLGYHVRPKGRAKFLLGSFTIVTDLKNALLGLENRASLTENQIKRLEGCLRRWRFLFGERPAKPQAICEALDCFLRLGGVLSKEEPSLPPDLVTDPAQEEPPSPQELGMVTDCVLSPETQALHDNAIAALAVSSPTDIAGKLAGLIVDERPPVVREELSEEALAPELLFHDD